MIAWPAERVRRVILSDVDVDADDEPSHEGLARNASDDQMAAAIASLGGVSTTELAALARISRQGAYLRLARLERAGRLRRDGRAWRAIES